MQQRISAPRSIGAVTNSAPFELQHDLAAENL
jgi:hypothetical protein